MRFRLRTLLMVVTGVCLFLGWTKYAQQMASYHHEEAARLISQIALTERAYEGDIEGGLGLLERHKTVSRPYPAKVFGRRVVSVRPPRELESLVFQTDPAEWERAMEHRARSKQYERAAWRPWLLLPRKTAP